jgi:hypothetical protein
VYRASPGCPSQQDFVAAVESRGSSFERPTAEQSAAAVFTIDIERAESDFVGSLQVKRATASSAAREVRGATCAEVVDALSLVTAIELRPVQDKDAKPHDSKQATTPPVAQTEAPKPEQVQGRSSWSNDVVRVNAGDVRFRSSLAWSLSAGAAIGPFPKLMLPRYDLVFQRATFVVLPDGRATINGPIFRVRATSFGPPASTYRASGADTEFQAGIGVGLGVCWSPYYDTAGLMLLACAEAGVAQWGATPIDSNGNKGKTIAIGVGTTGPLVEANYKLGSIIFVGGRIGADLVAGSFTAKRADGSQVSMASYSAYGSLTLGVHFW